NRFTAEGAFKIVAVFFTDSQKDLFKADLPQRFANEETANKFLADCLSADFHIKSLETKPGKRNPAAPFTTSTLHQEASRKLGFSVSRTMTIAQKLYESGKISYMRTDSVKLSQTARNAAEKEIKSAYGEKYYKHRQYTTKSSNAQE